MSLCRVCIQERCVIKSRLWWCPCGTSFSFVITFCQPIVCSGFIQKYPAIYHQLKQVQTDFDWNDFKWEIHLVYFAGSHYCLPIWVVTISDQPHLVPKKIQREINDYSEQTKTIIRQSSIWYAGSMGRSSHWPSIWCSKYYYFS